MKFLLVWKSKTKYDSYRVTWSEGMGFTASYYHNDAWSKAESNVTAEDAIQWITNGNVKEDILII